MMVEFKWISLFLTAVLQFTAVAGNLSIFIVRDGDEVTLPCGNVIGGQDKCDSTSWIFSATENTAPVWLIERGQISEKAIAKSERLNVTAKCSLVVKNITAEDAGYYTCRQLKSSLQDAHVHLSVVNMTEYEDGDKVTLTCSVSTYAGCEHTVKWLYEGKDVEEDNKDKKTLQSDCSVTVTFLPSYLKANYRELLKCKVTDIYIGKVQLFPFIPQLSDEETVTSFEQIRHLVSVGLAALIVIVVAVNIWTRTKGTKTQMDENTVNNDEDEDDGMENNENSGDPSASARPH
ncbi:uncharacterized protein LOC119908723 [Micropterus salmoides]|uniref:uncharacterized protein LOC119908723 n=1 Tax=Micropterus salmoides TaxID=27706 RepID=UPI0018EAF537|nr:uncharacterized protein LOC119908723 [Micropterus salmoides]